MERKRGDLVLLLLILILVLTSCASHRVAIDTHLEQRDSVAMVSRDSVEANVVQTDSVVKTFAQTSNASCAASEVGSYEDITEEHITETTDSLGNKRTVTKRTIHRTGDYEKQYSFKEEMQHQQYELEQMRRSIDSLSLSNKADVGTHWAVSDSSNVEDKKNTEEVQTQPWWTNIRRHIYEVFLFVVVVVMLLTLKRKEDEKKQKG